MSSSGSNLGHHECIELAHTQCISKELLSKLRMRVIVFRTAQMGLRPASETDTEETTSDDISSSSAPDVSENSGDEVVDAATGVTHYVPKVIDEDGMHYSKIKHFCVLVVLITERFSNTDQTLSHANT